MREMGLVLLTDRFLPAGAAANVPRGPGNVYTSQHRLTQDTQMKGKGYKINK